MSQGFNRKIILLFLFLSACTAPLTDLPLFSQEIAHIDDFVLKEDVLRFRLKLELDKYPAEFFNENGGRSTKNPQFLAIVEDLTNKIITDYTIIAYGKRHKIEIDPTELENQVSERQRQTNPKSFENFD